MYSASDYLNILYSAHKDRRVSALHVDVFMFDERYHLQITWHSRIYWRWVTH